jgi:transposase
METIVERPAALDVHKEQVTACVRVPAAAGKGREQHVAEFKTTVRGLLALRDWLAAHRVEQVVMEATGVFWKPIWHVLEDDFPLILVNARHVKQVPGRKTDVSDAAWLCQLLEAGLLKASFVPPKPIRNLRNLTRYRKTQIQERQREANRLHKALEDTGIKLNCVASDILGVSGRLMLDALVHGTTDPEVLADLAKGRLRAKLPALKEALEGRFDHLHSLWIGAILAHIDFLDEQIDRLSDAIEEQIAPFAAAVELLCTIPGVQRRAAEVFNHLRDRDRHERVPDRQAPRVVGRTVPRQRPVRRQAPLREVAEGIEVVGLDARGVRACRGPRQGRLPRRPIRPPQTSPRAQEGARRGQALDHLRLLAHAHHRRALQRPRRRLLPTPRPRTRSPTTRQTTRSARTPRHAPTNINGNGNGRGGRGSLNVIFLSVSLAGCAGDLGRVKMLDDPGVVRRTSRFLWCF